MLDMNPTAEQLIYEATSHELFQNFVDNAKAEENVKIKSAFPNFAMNRLVYSVQYSQEIKDLAEKYHDRKISKRDHGYQATIGFNSYLDVTKMGNNDMSFDESMVLIRKIRESLGTQFYGALISNNKMHDVNPLHALVLHQFMLLSDKKKKAHKLEGYSVIVYTYKDKKLQNKYPQFFKRKKEYKKDIPKLIASSINETIVETKISKQRLEKVNNKYIIIYDEVSIDENGKELKDPTGDYKRNYIIPGQILNLNGISYPYYGAIHIKGGRAWNINPMWATNIDNPGNNGVKTGSSICTKVGDPRTARGCMTLNHSNTTSQRNPYTLVEGSLGYAQDMIDFSLGMYFDDYEAPAEPEIPKMSMKEFQEKGLGDRKNYLMYLKDRLENKLDVTKK